MKQYLILIALAMLAGAALAAKISSSGPQQPAADPQSATATRTGGNSGGTAAPGQVRQLSEQERAELRRQLYEYRRQTAKRS